MRDVMLPRWVGVLRSDAPIPKWVLVCLSLWGLFILQPLYSRVGCYHGRVVDADTGKPIERAVVVARWDTKPIIKMDGGGELHSVRETLTDSDGYFSLLHWPGINVAPFTYVGVEPWIVIFKEGYGPFPYEHIAPRDTVRFGHSSELDRDERNAMLLEGTTVHLSSSLPKDVLRRHTDASSMLIVDTSDTGLFPSFEAAVQRHRRLLGLAPWEIYQ